MTSSESRYSKSNTGFMSRPFALRTDAPPYQPTPFLSHPRTCYPTPVRCPITAAPNAACKPTWERILKPFAVKGREWTIVELRGLWPHTIQVRTRTTPRQPAG